MPDIDQAVFQCPLSGRRLQLTLVVRLVVLVVSAFKCPLRGRGLQHSNRFATNCAKQFQSPLSGRGLQQNWLTRIVSMHCFNALLAGGVCSTVARTAASSRRPSFNALLAGGVCSMADSQQVLDWLVSFNALLAGGVCSFDQVSRRSLVAFSMHT